VVLYSTEHNLLPSEMPLSQWDKVVDLWTRRTAELSEDARVKHIAIFENTGAAVGVTMPHPHGQIYAFPFVPPRVEREWGAASVYSLQQKKCLHCNVLDEERREQRRVIAENASFTAFVPSFARFPYEMQIYAIRHMRSLSEFRDGEAEDLSSILLSTRKRYDRLFGGPMPLMMLLHQTLHLYVEFLPLQRSAHKLKYLASVESSLGTFLQDVNPEAAAVALRNLII